MQILAVMHESIYCGVYIMNEEDLLVQICGLYKESKGIVGKRALWNSLSFFMVLLARLLAVLPLCVPLVMLFCEMESSPREIKFG